MDYYDLVLGSIPASLVGGTGMLGILGIDLWTAVPVAAFAALLVILHALFVRAPTSVASRSERPATASPAAGTQTAE